MARSIIKKIRRLFWRSSSNAISDQDLLRGGGFDETFYAMQTTSFVPYADAVSHYLNVGWKSGLDPVPWFSGELYLEHNPDVRHAGENPFLHFMKFGRSEGRKTADSLHCHALLRRPAEIRDVPVAISPAAVALSPVTPSQHEKSLVAPHFDPAYYLGQLPHLDAAAVDLVDHYCTFGWRCGFNPTAAFSVSRYLAANPDVRRAGVEPFYHFHTQGKEEGRRAFPVAEEGEPLGDGRAEWVDYRYVRARGAMSLELREPHVESVDFTVALGGLDLVAELKRIAPAHDERKPVVSVIIPTINLSLLTAEAIASVFKYAGDLAVEIILVDNGSSEPFYDEIGTLAGITLLRFATNIGFGPGCNAGAERAQGDYLLFLNNDAQVGPGCIATLLKRLRKEKTAAIVGPKILSFDGTLQEAGVLINPDGTGSLIGFGYHPETPRFNYPRRVEHVSGAAIMMERKLFEKLGGFDDMYAPAYCEDTDLSMKARAAGLSIIYEPAAVVAHHLSKTTNKKTPEGQAGLSTKLQLIARNRVRFIKKWSEEVNQFDVRTIAFYLPQYHPIPENDLWWGKGFTEWRNLAKTKPNFVGHRQPRFPAELGYYDLRVSEIMEQQAALARRYGVSGFCYYYYWFSGKKVLEMPIERMLATGKPDLPFCLCWANENWTKRWDGRDDDILLKQSYEDSDAIEFAEDVVRYFRMPTYITVNGKPLILIYRVRQIPNSKRFIAACRNVWRMAGFDEVVVAMVESFELSKDPQPPANFGADVSVEFPAHGMVHDPAIAVKRLNANWEGALHDYRELASAFMTRKEVGFHRYRSVLVGWDTTPRHPDRSLVLDHSTPGAFQAWLEWTYRRTREQNFGDDRIVFVNAWNEWCEGSYLEPDSDYGHGFLQAVKNAQEAMNGRRSFETA